MRPLRLAAVCLVLATCQAAPDLPPVPQFDPGWLGGLRFKSVLVAGSPGPEFDNAVIALAARLPPGATYRLTAAAAQLGRGIEPATRVNLLARIRSLKPAAGEGCFVYLTSHGLLEGGFVLEWRPELLTPAQLDAALAQGCGNAPTAVVVSACYSGDFAEPPMTRSNRVILVASRADRQSFGCGSGDRYPYFDGCLIAAADLAQDWRDLFAQAAACVDARETQSDMLHSLPQAHFGERVADALALPWRR